MPNWCQNNLSIYGKQEEMKKIMEIITIREDEYSLLDTLYPTPEELNIGDVSIQTVSEQQTANFEKFGYKSWYEWRIDKWGTKWPETDISVGQEYTENQDGTSVIAFNFDTAWGPPIDAFNKISKDYPDVLFCLYFEETGMGFCGSRVWAKGEIELEEDSQIITTYFEEDYLFETLITNKQESE